MIFQCLGILVLLSISSAANANISYFGYFGSAQNGHQDVTSTVAQFSNTIWIRGDTVDEVRQKLAKAQSLNMAAIVIVQNVMFPWHSSHLHPDYRERFKSFHEALVGYHYLIAAYYIFDEPYWSNYQPSINSQSDWKSTYNEALYWNLYSAIDAVHTYAPGKPTAVTFSFQEVSPQLRVPENLDWVGFDCWITDRCTNEKLTEAFNLMTSNFVSGQRKMFVLLDSYWGVDPSGNLAAVEDQLVDRIRLWQQKIAANHDKIIGVFPFLYQTDLSDPTQPLWGAQSFPNVLSYLQIYFGQLSGRVFCANGTLINVTDPTLTWVGAPNCR